MGRIGILVVLLILTGIGWILLWRSPLRAVRRGSGEVSQSGPGRTPAPGLRAPSPPVPANSGVHPQGVAETLEATGEPFSDEFLDRLEALLQGAQALPERLRLAAVLHRYHRPNGTKALLELGTRGEESSEVALTTLALSKTPQALDAIVRAIASGPLTGEFLDALAGWPEPAIVDALRARLESGAAPGPLIARALLQQGNPAMAARATPARQDWPSERLDAAAIASRSGGVSDPGWARVMSAGVQPGSGLDAPMLIRGARMAGPVAARAGVTAHVADYARLLDQWNRDYADFVRDLRRGTREWAPVNFDVLPFDTAMAGAELLGEWGPDPQAAAAVNRLLEVHLQGRHAPVDVERLMMALMRLDPRDAAARLDSLGVDPAQTEAVRILVSLNALPRGLLPAQLSKRAPVKIPGEE